MKINLVPSLSHLDKHELPIHPTVVVYDVFRASSTIITALARGAQAIIPILDPLEAKTLYDELRKRKSALLLGGERQGKKIEDFHLGNSPLEYERSKVQDHTIVFTTTNGTRALIKSRQAGAKTIIIGGLLNQRAIVDYLQKEKACTLVCAGVRGEFAFEDFYGAGLMLQALITKLDKPELDDGALAALGLAQGHQGKPQIIAQSKRGQELIKERKNDEVEFCSRTDLFSLLPVYNQEKIIPSPNHPGPNN